MDFFFLPSRELVKQISCFLPSRIAVNGTPSSAFMLMTFRATSCPFILEELGLGSGGKGTHSLRWFTAVHSSSLY